jgi:Uma2 family endonuclease
MKTATTPAQLSAEELLAMPENGFDRWLIRGALKEKAVTIRNRFHSRVMIRIGQLLLDWLDQQPEPRGEILGGEAGILLGRNPDTLVGVDIAYVSAEIAARLPEGTTLIDGVPILIAEILSPSDTLEEILEKVAAYLRAGVALVWIGDPTDRTVRIYRQNARPQLVNEEQELSGEPNLPGFHVAVRRLFE